MTLVAVAPHKDFQAYFLPAVAALLKTAGKKNAPGGYPAEPRWLAAARVATSRPDGANPMTAQQPHCDDYRDPASRNHVIDALRQLQGARHQLQLCVQDLRSNSGVHPSAIDTHVDACEQLIESLQSTLAEFKSWKRWIE